MHDPVKAAVNSWRTGSNLDHWRWARMAVRGCVLQQGRPLYFFRKGKGCYVARYAQDEGRVLVLMFAHGHQNYFWANQTDVETP